MGGCVTAVGVAASMGFGVVGMGGSVVGLAVGRVWSLHSLSVAWVLQSVLRLGPWDARVFEVVIPANAGIQ